MSLQMGGRDRVQHGVVARLPRVSVLFYHLVRRVRTVDPPSLAPVASESGLMSMLKVRPPIQERRMNPDSVNGPSK